LVSFCFIGNACQGKHPSDWVKIARRFENVSGILFVVLQTSLLGITNKKRPEIQKTYYAHPGAPVWLHFTPIQIRCAIPDSYFYESKNYSNV
jgi:hypothetical protein